MDTERTEATPLVLVVTRHHDFAAAAAAQLHGLDLIVQTLSPDAAQEAGCLRETVADIALVDFDAKTSESLPLYQALANAVPNCQIILICTREQAAGAARLARLWEVFDYVLTDAGTDPNRIPLLVERARTNCMPELSEIRGHAKLQYRRILELLAELKTILKTSMENPVVKAIEAYKWDGSFAERWCDPSERPLADIYQRFLVDLVCGRLRRLENEIRLSGEVAEAPVPRGGSTEILVVDDDIISAELAKNILERNGFDVLIAKTPEDTKLALLKRRPSLVLMDVHLSGANGLELVKMLRRGSEYPDVPVVVVTCDKTRDTLLRALDANIQGYLLKPYSPCTLIDKVKAALARPRTRDQKHFTSV